MNRGVRLARLVAAVPERLDPRLVPTATTPADDPIVVDVTHDSRQVGPGWMFVAVVGEHVDGHAHAHDAVASGATALVVERVLDLDVPQLVVTSTREAMGHVAAALHGHPSRALTTVGITGTNGKTTTAQLLSAALGPLGPVEVFGTLSGARTTPEATDLQRRLATARDAGSIGVVMEVSSHALALHRVDGTRFDVSIFTNLGRDHLDLHGTVEEYFRAKASLFTPELTDVGVVNVDDAHGRLLLDASDIDVVPYSVDHADDVVVVADHLELTWRGRRVTAPIGGSFNVSNVVGTLTAADVLGVDPEAAIHHLAGARPVPGRFEVVSGPEMPFTVVVDYAHTPDGLDALLRSVRAVAGEGRVHVVFGCGGDRDRDKRPAMGRAAVRGADVAIVTSDNPRHEDPLAIIDAVLTGIDPSDRPRVRTEPDRRSAIASAVADARPGDVVVIAGKGHESTQTIGDEARPFDDRVVAREALEARS